MDAYERLLAYCLLCQDYVDAYERLLALGLKQQQRREILHVVVDVCLQEQSYNPFYAHLAQRFCQHDRKYQVRF